MSAVTEAVVYAYALTRPVDPTRLVGLRGVDGAPVRLVAHSDIAVVVSTLGEAVLPDQLEGPADLAALESLARAHHAVVDALADLGVVVPFRLATVYLGDGRVAELLRQRHRTFRTALDRVAGRVELGVKVYAVPGASPEPVPDTTASSSPGRDYLRNRRHAAQRRERTFSRAAAAARQLDHDLAKLADDVTHHRPQDPQLSGADGENVLNVAYLVDEGLVDAFVTRAREVDTADGVEVVVTGPWAPYSFATVTEEVVG